MKKVINTLLISLLVLIPFTVSAEDNCSKSITIKNIDLVKVEGKANETADSTIDNQLIKLNLKFKAVGDKAIYKVLLKNNSEEEFKLNEDKIYTNSKYIDCNLKSLDNSKIIGSKKEKEVLLTIEYTTPIKDELFENYEYRLDEEVTINLYNNKTTNPVTSTGIISIVFIILLLVIFTISKKKRIKLLSIFILSIIIPISVNAICNATIKVKPNVVFEKIPVAPTKNCHFDGDLVQGAEYTDGQYVYRYLQEGSAGHGWNNISEGWGMKVVDYNSTEPLTSEMCTYINDIPVTSLAYSLYDTKATSIDLTSFNTSNIKSMEGTFRNVQAHFDLRTFDTSKVKTMWGMFAYDNLNNIDLSYLNTSNVESMVYMFGESEADNLDLTGFDLSKVTDMEQMFIKAKINNLNMSNVNTSKLQIMKEMFREFEGNVNLSGINTSSVTNMNNAFLQAKTNNIDFSSFDTSKVTNMNSMFYEAEMDIIDVSSFTIESLASIRSMFSNTKARIVDISGFHITKPIEFRNMFASAPNLETIYASESFNPSFLSGNDNFYSNTKLKGMNGTSCANVSSSNDLLYMRIDQGTSSPGCFSSK